MLDSRKQLFEELLWEHRNLIEAFAALQVTHSQCQGLFEPTGFFCTGFYLVELCYKASFVQLPCRKLRLMTSPAKSLRLKVSRFRWFLFLLLFYCANSIHAGFQLKRRSCLPSTGASWRPSAVKLPT